MSKKFQRNIEDFDCEKCSVHVEGTGYTNHCPKCLWSKHVDVHPGDRESLCGGMMEPVDLEIEEGEQVLVHKCAKCGHVRRNKVQEVDDAESIIALAKQIAERKSNTTPF